MRKPTYRFFDEQEYAGRLTGLRQRMQDAGIDALLVNTPESIFYLCGYQSPGYYFYMGLVVPVDRDPVLIPPPHEESLVAAFAWIDEYRIYPDTTTGIDATRDLLLELGLGSAAIGLEERSWFLTGNDRTRLVEGLPDARFVDGSGLVEEGRLIKSEAELEYVRRAASAATDGMRAGLDAARAGVTELEVAAEIHRAQLLAGSEYTGLPTFVTSGERSMLVHATWSPRELAGGDSVFLEVPGCINRYHVAMTRTAYAGEPPNEYEAAFEVAKRALEKAKGSIAPGVPASQTFEVGRAAIDDAGLGYHQARRLAYGIGIAFPPGWDEGHIMSINRNERRPFRPGMTFHLITTMRIPGIGAIGCSDTVLVTEDGCDTLTAGVEHGIHPA